MAKKHKYGEITKVIGIRVPISKFEEMKKPIRDFTEYHIKTGHTLKDLKDKHKDERKIRRELLEFKMKVVREWRANELTPEDFHDILMADSEDYDC